MLQDERFCPNHAHDDKGSACVRGGIRQIAAAKRPSLWVETLVLEGHVDVILVASGHRQIRVGPRGGHCPSLEVWPMRRLRSICNGLTGTHYQAFWTDSHDKVEYAVDLAITFAEHQQCRNR